ncbi:MAG TPA: hypothetical protein DD791_09800 [Syntrophomonas sp.]|jgi:hypothetical protein|nr:hypothetical protein [Syntrophomonas sp.]
MAPLAPFVFKLSFKLPEQVNQEKNIKHLDYITRPDAIDYGDLEPENHIATPQAQAEEHGEDPEHVIYAQYIHERPRSQGLFSRDGPADFDATKDAISAHEGIVWRAVISLREDEAVRINHIDQSKWMESIQSSFPKIAEQLGIAESNLEWVAAYHPEPGHPHCHIMFWEKEPERTRGMFSEGERRDVRKTFINNIYAQERERLFVEKTFYRDEVRNGVRDILGLRQELDRQTEIVRAEIGGTPGIAPRITPEQKQELDQRLQSLAEILPGHGRVALGFMPEEVKTEVREIADWVLQQPGFIQEVEKYLEAHTQITSIYIFQEKQVNQARERAYNDLQDRLSQDILKAAVQHQRQAERLNRSNSDESRNINFLSDGSNWAHQGRGNSLSVGEKEKKETEAWYRSTFRLVERERASVVVGERLRLPDFANYQEGLDKLTEIASQIPEDFKGRPVIAFLPDELKEQVREAADWLLTNSDIQSPLRDYLETIPGDPDAAYNQIRDRVAENAFAHALRLKVRLIEMPKIKMVLHEQRAEIAKKQLSIATTDVVLNDAKEARWTLNRMHEALTKMGAPREEVQEIITRWARDAGIESSVDRILQRTYDGERDIDFIGRANWNRMCDNLGYHEHELLNPWMGQIVPPEKQEQETEPVQQQLPAPISPPDFLPEHIPAILETYNSVIAKPELALDKDELQWTIWTSSWVLKELGVDTRTRLQVLNDWVQRSGIEMSQARVADTIHRANLSREDRDEDAVPRWLGRDNWERLMRNIGAENPPDRPWEYPAQGFNFAGAIWKGLWQSIQRERTKSEYQARRLEAQREYEEKRRREGRDR